MRRGRWIFFVTAIFAFLVPGKAYAYSYTVSEETDFYFTVDGDNTLVVIYGNSNRECNQPGADPYLWVYEDGVESSGALVAANDDGNHGSGQCVSSKIYATLDAGDYRLRAGYCCSLRGLGANPSGYDYEIVTDLTFDGFSPNTPTTTTTSTTTTSTSTTTTTTVPQTIGPPMNLTGSIVEVWVGEQVSGGVYLDWDPPNTGNVDPERYAISFRIPPDAGWAVATGNVGDENALNTEYTLPFSIFESTGGFGEEYVFDVRADNDTLGVYSGWSTQVALTVEEPTPPTTTTTTTTTPTTSTTTTTTSTTSTTTTTTTSTTTTSTTTTTLPPTTTTEVLPSTTTSTSTTTTTSTVPPTIVTTSTTSTIPTTTSTTSTTVAPVVTTVVPTTTTPTTTTTTSLSPTTTSSSTTSTTVLSATTTNEPRPTTTTSIPQPAPTGEIAEKEAKAAIAVASIDDAETAKAVTDIVTSEKVTVEEFQNLVESTDIEDLPDEAKEAIAVALTFADDEVKEEFESEVNVFEGGFDSYVPSGSTVSVETRRIIVAATAVTMAVPVASSGSGGGSEPSGTRRKK